eukprot:COSAG01_NODE_4618_length_4876_cov_8.446305_5_plen_50_part_00
MLQAATVEKTLHAAAVHAPRGRLCHVMSAGGQGLDGGGRGSALHTAPPD